jgi:tetratricopeptide (TPR) repeat protein
MAIEGVLREIAVADLLQLIYLSRKSGVLAVSGSEGAAPTELYFDRGVLVGSRSGQDAPRLGELLVAAGGATDGQVRRALAAQERFPARLLGGLLVEQGVPAAEVLRQLAFQLRETAFELLRRPDGEFRFEEADITRREPLAVRVGIEALLMDGLQRADEWGALPVDSAERDLIPRLVEAETEDGALALQPLEWEVLAGVDGETSLRSIAHRLARSELDVAKAIFFLMGLGLVELGPRVSGRSGGAVGIPREAEARVRAELRAGLLDQADRGIAALLEEAPDRAEFHALRGDAESARGRWAEAAACYDLAVRLDPLLAEAYYSLAIATLRTGQITRALDAFDTYVRVPGAGEGQIGRATRATLLLQQIQTFLEEEGA